MLKQLRHKFIFVNMVIVTVMLCVIFGLVIYFTGANLETESIQAMEDIAKRPGDRPGFMDADLSQPYYLVQVNRRGEITGDWGTFPIEAEQLLDLTEQVLSAPEAVGELAANNLRYLRANNPMGQTIVLAGTLGERQTMRDLGRTCAFIGVISFLVFFVISMLFSRWAVKPVASAFEEQKQFVADASHELKTPLAVIMTNAELLQQQSSGESGQFAGNILTMTRQMRSLVESLLELARVDNGAVKMAFSQVDMSGLAEMSLLLFEPVFFEKGLTLTGSITPGITLTGSESHLRQTVEILLDNAAKYASSQSRVQLTLLRQGKSCLLSVANEGAPISKEDLKNIFKRFYRVDKARSRNGSYGLGLSIAQSIIDAHGGRIWAESHNGINSFHIQLPLQ